MTVQIGLAYTLHQPLVQYVFAKRISKSSVRCFLNFLKWFSISDSACLAFISLSASRLVSFNSLTRVSYPSAFKYLFLHNSLLHAKEPVNFNKNREIPTKKLCYSLFLLVDAMLIVTAPCTYRCCKSINIHDTNTHLQARDCMKNIKTFRYRVSCLCNQSITTTTAQPLVLTLIRTWRLVSCMSLLRPILNAVDWAALGWVTM
jgi:hypothetical protein